MVPSHRGKEVSRHNHHGVRIAQLKGLGRDTGRLDAVQTQRAYCVTEVIPDEKVPSWPCQQQVMGLDDTSRRFALGPILDLDGTLLEEAVLHGS